MAPAGTRPVGWPPAVDVGTSRRRVGGIAVDRAESSSPRVLFVTGRLAEPVLRQTLADLAARLPIRPEVAVLPISVAALMTPRWVARHLRVPEGVDRVILPGHCRGDLADLRASLGVPVEVGPEDLRDLPRMLGMVVDRDPGYGAHDIEILAEINHAPRLALDDFLAQAERFRTQGADRIDVGCDPDGGWLDVGRFVAGWVERGGRASVDSFDPREVERAVRAGADLVLSVNATNRAAAPDWGVEVVAIPDVPGTLSGLDATVDFLEARGVRYRLDPILEPIGCGFAASLGRYAEVRRRWPEAEILMGIGNLTELTDVDSAGVNMLLVGFCQELGIRSVLTTAVAPWTRSSVAEVDIARRPEPPRRRPRDAAEAGRPPPGRPPRPARPRVRPIGPGRDGGTGQGPELADLRRRGADPCLQQRPPPRRDRPVPDLQPDGGGRSHPQLLPRPRAEQGPDRPDPGQGLSSGPGARLGAPDRARDQPPPPARAGSRAEWGAAVILEGVVTTLGADGTLNVAPMGPEVDDDGRLARFTLRPYRTSTTLRNLLSTRAGVLHITDDVELIARAAIKRLGPVESRPARAVPGRILATTGRYHEFRVVAIDQTHDRATVTAETVAEGRQAVDLFGFNRGKHAVVEAAILATRVAFLDRAAILADFARLAVWVDKTGGPAERRAFDLLHAHVRDAAGRG